MEIDTYLFLCSPLRDDGYNGSSDWRRKIDNVFHRHNQKQDSGLVREHTRRHTYECSVGKDRNFRTAALLAKAKLIEG